MIELTFNVYSLLITIAVIIAITFGFLLLLPSANKKANRLLAILMLIVALWNTSILTFDLGLYRYAAGVIWLPFKYTLALGPCLYFYVRLVTDFEMDQPVKMWPHFLPVVFEVLLFLYQVYHGLPQGLGYSQTSVFLLLDPVVNFLAILSLLVYGYFSMLRVKKYHGWVKDNYSHYHRYNLNWLFRLSLVIVLLLLLWLGYLLIDYFVYEYQLSYVDYYPFHLALSIISIWLCIESFSKPALVYPEVPISKHQADDEEMPDEKTRQMALWLDQQVTENLLYLDPELSLRSLASTLDLHPNLLSKIINEGHCQNFSDYINKYRVEAVVNKIVATRTEKVTLLAIALDCGFNSKTTFNRIFKKYQGITPNQFRKNVQQTEKISTKL